MEKAIVNELATVAKKINQITVRIRNTSRTVGSGVIWYSNPRRHEVFIITNAHVATNNSAIVELWNGTVFEARRFLFDPQQDLAAFKINTLSLSLETSLETSLEAAIIGNPQNLRVGELVLAIGNPLDDKGAVTTGIVYKPTNQAVIADINLYPGNSGGPLTNCLGQVVGINTMIANGLAVAIPSTTVNQFLTTALTHGMV
jgi:serine protease Do